MAAPPASSKSRSGRRRARKDMRRADALVGAQFLVLGLLTSCVELLRAAYPVSTPGYRWKDTALISTRPSGSNVRLASRQSDRQIGQSATLKMDLQSLCVNSSATDEREAGAPAFVGFKGWESRCKGNREGGHR